MPVIKSAKKKLRKDKKRQKDNLRFKSLFKKLIKKARVERSEKTIKDAVSVADKLAKKHIFHKNKVDRVKSKLSKLLKRKTK